jgi:hypothetical protein
VQDPLEEDFQVAEEDHQHLFLFPQHQLSRVDEETNS